MKRTCFRLMPLVLGILLIVSCKNNNKQVDTNPIYRQPELKDITSQINSHPKDAELYYQRGNILRHMNMDTLALDNYKKATSLDSTKAKYFSAVGNVLFDNKDVTGSVKWLQQAIKLNPKDPVAHLKIAKMFVFTRDYAKAFSEINLVLRQDVYNPEAYFLKGLIYKDLKDTSKAISSFQTAVDVSPTYIDAINEIGELYSAQHNPLALKYYDKAFDADTTDVFPLYAKGMYYQQQKLYEQAKQEYKNCIMHNSHYANAYYNIGWILMQQDSLQKAWRQYNLVTEIEPGNPNAYYNRGLCSEIMNNKPDAIKDYQQALLLDSTYQKGKEGLKRLGIKD